MTDWDQPRFERLYSEGSDPYGLRTRWYEIRKRSLLLAALPRPRYGRAFEPACGIGELTRVLAPRCEQLMASDFSAHAVATATERTRDLSQVRIEQRTLPRQWPRPEGGFDLLVLSEFCYFLDEAAMARVARCCDETLAADGTLVACNWLAPFEGRRLPTAHVHEALASIGLPLIAHYVDDDFLLSVWCRDPRSVALRDGIRP